MPKNLLRMCFLAFALLLGGCDQPKEGHTYVYRNGEYVQFDGTGAVYSQNPEFSAVVNSARERGYADGYAKGMIEGKRIAVPKGWEPADGFSQLLFGGAAILGLLAMGAKILVFAFVLVSAQKGDSAFLLTSGTIFLSGILFFIFARITTFDDVVIFLTFAPNPSESWSILTAIAISAAVTLGLILSATALVEKVDSTLGLVFLCIAHGIFSTIVLMAFFYATQLANPMGHLITLLAIGIFAGATIYGLNRLYRQAVEDQKPSKPAPRT